MASAYLRSEGAGPEVVSGYKVLVSLTPLVTGHTQGQDEVYSSAPALPWRDVAGFQAPVQVRSLQSGGVC